MKKLIVSVTFLLLLSGCFASNSYQIPPDPYTRYFDADSNYLGYSLNDPFYKRAFTPDSKYLGYSPR